ncbi:hypothetical protein ACVWWU_000326 [Pantoea sp. PA1]|jgi:hypothetical protein|nr:hypothetical protein C7422_10542 [Pantoea ananatis]REE70074.1 hypothetical protein C7424_1928 [Pantoea ananatis]REF12128.1 hypothetical protein C7428_1376 [Pantoea ananatis]CRH38403.1 hypothetical protein BN1184_AZ_00360 [Pantoea ananatis]SKA65155.1 hypothetical protein SAMN03097719_0952 [Pantoea ananatis]
MKEEGRSLHMIKEDNQVWESEGKCLYKCFWDVTLSVPASITL